MKNKKICIILGTRPEIIKMAPIIRECKKRKLNYFVLHTGQHYDFIMDKVFFNELELSPETINLNIKSGTHGDVTGRMLIEIEKILIDKKPDIVIVQGDTNTALAGALAATKLQIKIAHIEAGLRSYDIHQPEDCNRIVIDHISNSLFAPTKIAVDRLKKEGIKKQNIYMVGNTVVDAVEQAIKLSDKNSKILEKLNLFPKTYFLATAHRQENVDSKERLFEILKGLKKISEEYNLPIVFPIHPRTQEKINKFDLSDFLNGIKYLKLIKPVGFFDFISLESNAKIVFTDSGGAVEECCILKIPCISMRDLTDRPESVKVGASILSGCNAVKILQASKIMVKKKTNWKNPFGDGNSSKKIIEVILRDL